MSGDYNPQLVALSITVAIIASYTALDLAGRVGAVRSRYRWFWLACGSFALGAGIWAMHFIGMLAFELPIPMAFDLSITALSLGIAVLSSGMALYVMRRPRVNGATLSASAALIGIGISAMHYTGMLAMRMSPPIQYTPMLFVASVLIAIAAALVALLIAFHLRSQHSGIAVAMKLGSAVVMGIAISGMHYTGMAAAKFAPGSVCLAIDSTSAIASGGLAVAVGVVTLVILVGTLGVSSLHAHFAQSLHVANERLRSIALYDSLTGLPNRLLFHDRLEQAISRAQRSGKKCAVMFIDIDGFKAVNDALGHDRGDDLLRQAAQRMCAAIRKDDTVARLAGDEFVVVATEISAPADAAKVAQNLVAELRRPFTLESNTATVSASVGISVYPDDASESASLLKNADAAMYTVKNDGKDAVALFGQPRVCDAPS